MQTRSLGLGKGIALQSLARLSPLAHTSGSETCQAFTGPLCHSVKHSYLIPPVKEWGPSAGMRFLLSLPARVRIPSLQFMSAALSSATSRLVNNKAAESTALAQCPARLGVPVVSAECEPQAASSQSLVIGCLQPRMVLPAAGTLHCSLLGVLTLGQKSLQRSARSSLPGF